MRKLTFFCMGNKVIVTLSFTALTFEMPAEVYIVISDMVGWNEYFNLGSDVHCGVAETSVVVAVLDRDSDRNDDKQVEDGNRSMNDLKVHIKSQAINRQDAKRPDNTRAKKAGLEKFETERHFMKAKITLSRTSPISIFIQRSLLTRTVHASMRLD